MSDSLRPVALVTGASSGIGEEFARRLARDGYDLFLVARRRDRLEALARLLEQGHGGRCSLIEADLATAEGMALTERAIADQAGLELLVNNAGFMTAGKFAQLPAERHDEMIRLHVQATVRLTRAAVAPFLSRGRGAVVNVSSVASFLPLPGNVVYCATKAFITTFTEALALELTGSNVKVQALCPGYTRSELHERQGIDPRKIADRWWMSAEAVVDASMAGLAAGDVVVVPGAANRALVEVGRRLPRPVLYRILARRKRRRNRA